MTPKDVLEMAKENGAKVDALVKSNERISN